MTFPIRRSQSVKWQRIAPAPSCITSRRQSKVWHMVSFHAWQESIWVAHHCYCQIGPAVYSSITPSSLTVTGHHALYMNSDCDIDLFPQSFGTDMPPVCTRLTQKKHFLVFPLWLLVKTFQTLQSFVSVLSCVGLVVVFQSRGEMLLAAREHPTNECEFQDFAAFICCWVPINNGRQGLLVWPLNTEQLPPQKTTPPGTIVQFGAKRLKQGFSLSGGGGWFQFSSRPH